MPEEALPLLVHWEKVLGDLLDRTERFPKRVRFTFATRIEGLALDVLERLVEARYTRDKLAALRAANLDIEKLRVLLRLTYDRRHLDRGGFEHVARNLDEAGRMLGGWIRQQQER
jgi:hypothetical protein